MREGATKPRGRPTKQASDADGATRDRLLDATAEIMIERGTIEVSFADIVKRTDLNSALIGYYFGSKNGLMLALLRRVLGDGLEQLEHLLQLDISPEEKLRRHVNGLISSYFKYPFVNRLIHQLVVDEPDIYGPIIAEEMSKRVAAIQKQMLDEGVGTGRFKKIDPLHFYFHIVGACDQFFHGRFQMRHVFGNSEIDERMKTEYSDYLSDAILYGLLRRES